MDINDFGVIIWKLKILIFKLEVLFDSLYYIFHNVVGHLLYNSTCYT